MSTELPKVWMNRFWRQYTEHNCQFSYEQKHDDDIQYAPVPADLVSSAAVPADEIKRNLELRAKDIVDSTFGPFIGEAMADKLSVLQDRIAHELIQVHRPDTTPAPSEDGAVVATKEIAATLDRVVMYAGIEGRQERIENHVAAIIRRYCSAPTAGPDTPIDVNEQHDFVLLKNDDKCGLRGCTLGVLEHRAIPSWETVVAAAPSAGPEEQQSSDVFWREWFNRLESAATAEVVNATADLVTNERLNALQQAGILPAPPSTEAQKEPPQEERRERRCAECGHEGLSSFDGTCAVTVMDDSTELGWRRCGDRGHRCVFSTGVPADEAEKQARRILDDWHNVEKWHDPSMGPIPPFSGAQEEELMRLIIAALRPRPVGEASCWHCGVVLAFTPQMRCEDCPTECDIENCDELGCADAIAIAHGAEQPAPQLLTIRQRLTNGQSLSPSECEYLLSILPLATEKEQTP